MKPLRPARPHGGILILALLCSGLAVLALSHWVLTITARSRQVDTLEDVTKRRIARNNGRQLGFRHLQRNVLPATSGTAISLGFGTWQESLGNYEWGGVRLDSPWNGSPLASTTGSTGVNRLSPGDRAGFGLAASSGLGYDLEMHVLDGSQSVPHRWQARSYPPALAGDLLVVHAPAAPVTGPPPPVTLTGTLQVNGRAHFHLAGSPALSVDPAVSFHGYSTEGPAVPSRLVTNHPPVQFLSWTTGGTPIAGQSHVIWDESSTGHSLRHQIINGRGLPSLFLINGAVNSTSSNGCASDGNGTVTIDLNSPTLEGIIVENVQHLNITGQNTAAAWADAASWPTAVIVVHRRPEDAFIPATVSFRHKNNRRLVFAMRCESDPPEPVVLAFPEAGQSSAEVGPEWRMITVLEQTPVRFVIDGQTLNLTGGVTTDRSLAAPPAPGALRLHREPNPLALATKAPRRVWAEGFRRE